MIAVTPAAETTTRINCSAPSTKWRSVLADGCVESWGFRLDKHESVARRI